MSELSKRARQLMDAERAALTPTEASRVSIRRAARMALSLDLPPNGGSPSDAGGHTPTSAPAAGAAETLQSLIATKVGAVLLGTVFVAGAIVGAGVHALVSGGTDAEAHEVAVPVAPPPLVVEEIVEPVHVDPVEPAEVVVAPVVEVHEAPAPRTRIEPRVEPPAAPDVEGAPSGIVAERMLLERASVALRRGSADDAFAALAEHEDRFPSGILADEREGLRVLARFASGDRERAESEATAYLAQHPQGVLAGRIRRALEAR